ncbi:hypothetical protein Pelo_11448 [Pelomyxa schiedti]|nr:hypothetical protein Pelo_11448 [Pelomyxa schiedti]
MEILLETPTPVAEDADEAQEQEEEEEEPGAAAPHSDPSGSGGGGGPAASGRGAAPAASAVPAVVVAGDGDDDVMDVVWQRLSEIGLVTRHFPAPQLFTTKAVECPCNIIKDSITVSSETGDMGHVVDQISFSFDCLIPCTVRLIKDPQGSTETVGEQVFSEYGYGLQYKASIASSTFHDSEGCVLEIQLSCNHEACAPATAATPECNSKEACAIIVSKLAEEQNGSNSSTSLRLGEPTTPDTSPHFTHFTQSTTVNIFHYSSQPPKIRVVKQTLLLGTPSKEHPSPTAPPPELRKFCLYDIYGTGGSDTDPLDCVICMTEPRQVVMLPCRHMSVCPQCANTLQQPSSHCLLCRAPVNAILSVE